jgi:hypothetical protein
MTEDELRKAVADLPPKRRSLYEMIAERGPVTQRDMHEASGRKGKSAAFKEHLRPLEFAGLIRKAGRRRLPGSNASAWLYAAVPADQVEAQRRRGRVYPTPSPQDVSRPSRRLERGEFSGWVRARRRILENIELLIAIEPMVFWEAADSDDLEGVVRDLTVLREWIDCVADAFDMRQADDKTRDRIEKLRDVAGREPSEAPSYLAKADELERKL